MLSEVSNSKSRKNLNMKKGSVKAMHSMAGFNATGKGKNSIYLGKHNRGSSKLDASTK